MKYIPQHKGQRDKKSYERECVTPRQRDKKCNKK